MDNDNMETTTPTSGENSQSVVEAQQHQNLAPVAGDTSASASSAKRIREDGVDGSSPAEQTTGDDNDDGAAELSETKRIKISSSNDDDANFPTNDDQNNDVDYAIDNGATVCQSSGTAAITSDNNTKADNEGSSKSEASKIEEVKVQQAQPAEAPKSTENNGNTVPYEDQEQEKSNASPTKEEAAPFSPVLTRSRKSRKEATEQAPPSLQSMDNKYYGEEEESDKTKRPDGSRWRVHQMAEDYVGMVGKMMYPGTKLRPFGFDATKREYPLSEGGISVLGYMKSPLRRPTIVEKWSPYEIAMFEGALLHHGKEFHKVSQEIGSKTTKEVIDFYYIWKKTEHYKKWKDQFILDGDLIDPDDDDHPPSTPSGKGVGGSGGPNSSSGSAKP